MRDMSLAVAKPELAIPANYSIQPAAKEHLRAIPAIEVAAVSTFAEADIPLEIRYRVTAPDVLEDARAGGRLWVALDRHDRAIGFAMLEILDGLAHLDEIDVHPDHAMQGIGSRLLQKTIDWAVGEKYPAMTLVTFRHLPWNAPFYERFGFREIERAALSADLRELFQDEAATGLNMKNRIAMSLWLG